MKFKDDASMERMIDELNAKKEKEDKLIEEEIRKAKERKDNDTI